MKIIVLGAGGRVGRALNFVWNIEKPYANKISSSKFFLKQSCDIFDNDQLEYTYAVEKPDIVINCVCMSDVDRCETDREEADRLNAKSAEIIAMKTKKYGAKLIHISTDYVFDGKKNYPYTETDTPNPISYYGLTKLKGETLIKNSGVNHLIVRTSRLFGPFGDLDFPRKIIELVQKNSDLKIVNTQRGSPTYTIDLARCIYFLAANNVSDIINVANKGDCTWYEFAIEILKTFVIDKKIDIITPEETKRPAKRPDYSVLDCQKLDRLGFKMSHWKDSLKDFVKLYASLTL